MRGALFVGLVLSACRTSPVPSSLDAAVVAPLPTPAFSPGRVGPITDYHVRLATRGADVVLRAFEQNGSRWLVLLDPERLVTRVEPDLGEPVVEREWPELEATRTPWIEARLAAEQHAASLQDSGLTHLLPRQSGLVLTVDLCPSTKHFDLRLVKRLLEVVEPKEKPVPLAFAVSGVWLEEHPRELAELQALDGRDLDITWVNHSMHHRYDPNLPLQRNFLLESGTNLASEVLDAEVAMLSRGLTPSVFFRFPGLVSEPTLVTFVVALGLIPVGSDAWLAKGQHAKNGSIVLVHGNGNEPKGVDDFLHLLDVERRAISSRQFLLLDLREAVRETEEDAG
jgi:hypothetical protein